MITTNKLNELIILRDEYTKLIGDMIKNYLDITLPSEEFKKRDKEIDVIVEKRDKLNDLIHKERRKKNLQYRSIANELDMEAMN